jgi:zinc D-Ala-D-Ala carboxypeptidase
MNTKNYFFLCFLTIFSFFQCNEAFHSDANSLNSQSAEKESSLPQWLDKKEELDFLQGKFKPNSYLKPYNNPGGDTRQHFLLPEALTQYKKMIDAFDKYRSDNHPNYKQSIFIVSSFRDFYLQKNIWEGKYKGERKMRESVSGKSPEEIIALILEFSSAPGTSRHHWGTDMDLNSLQNSYFEKGGKGEIIYNWMQENAHKFGFCQPYNKLSERSGLGYNEEKWHWSYKPASSHLMKKWEKAYKSGEIKPSGYLGADILGDKALTYVTSVNKDCK